METITVQGTEVPKLGLGTWQLNDRECRESVTDALEIGYRHIDTAQVYENEHDVGDAILASGVAREEIFLTTKVFRDDLAAEDVRSTTERSLRRLKTEYVDLLLIHWPSDDVALKETLDAMIELEEQQKVRNIGVSNFTPTLVEEAREHAPIFCNQVEYHPYLDQSHLVEQCSELSMMLTAYSPLARGRAVEDHTLVDIGEAHGKSGAQVALRWLIQQEPVVAVPKAGSEEHRRDNLEIFDFELTSEEMSAISDLRGDERIIDPDWAPNWER